MGRDAPYLFWAGVYRAMKEAGKPDPEYLVEKEGDQFVCAALLSRKLPLFVGEPKDCKECATSSAAKKIYFYLKETGVINSEFEKKNGKPAKDNFCISEDERIREGFRNYGSWYLGTTDAEGNDLYPFPPYDAPDSPDNEYHVPY